MIIDLTNIKKSTDLQYKPENCKTVADVVKSVLEQVELQGGKNIFMKNFATEGSFLAEHMSLGRYIRNAYGLWTENSTICQDALNYPYPIQHPDYPGWTWSGPSPHPDDVSHLILGMVWKAVAHSISASWPEDFTHD